MVDIAMYLRRFLRKIQQNIILGAEAFIIPPWQSVIEIGFRFLKLFSFHDCVLLFPFMDQAIPSRLGLTISFHTNWNTSASSLLWRSHSSSQELTILLWVWPIKLVKKNTRELNKCALDKLKMLWCYKISLSLHSWATRFS